MVSIALLGLLRACVASKRPSGFLLSVAAAHGIEM